MALLVAMPTVAFAQTRTQGAATQGAAANQGAAASQAAAANGGRPPGELAPAVQPGQPFPPLSVAAQKRLEQLLEKWEAESQGTKLLSCDFTRWHYDLGAAPAGVHATWAQGAIKYAAPDKGMFRVDTLKFYKGMKEGKASYEADSKQLGEYWVCNGAEVLEFDRSKEECIIQVLPEEMRGQQILESPLPFVFNLDAKKIHDRYWVREVQPPAGKTGVYLIEAWPKRQEDRSQYKFVQIVISAQTFMPDALIMYAPNFDPQTAPIWDHYEFTKVSRNGLVANLQQFTDAFIKARPPSNWKVIRQKFGALQQAANPDANPVR